MNKLYNHLIDKDKHSIYYLHTNALYKNNHHQYNNY